MSNSLAVKSVLQHQDGTTQDVVHFFCPGCKSMHHVGVGGTSAGLPNWEWNGRLDEGLTVSPSILCHLSVHFCEDMDVFEDCADHEFAACGHKGHHLFDDGRQAVFIRHGQDPAYGSCHSFLRDGVWEFLSDSGHELAGQRVPMVPIPDWAKERWA